MDQLYCLRWNNYQHTVQGVFHKLYNNSKFTDVTLASEGKSFHCHKVVLSACSSYFEDILTDHTHPNPLFLLHDVSPSILDALVTFMYLGEVNVNNEDLPNLLKVADAFKIKGLADSTAVTNFANSRLSTSTPTPTSDHAYLNSYATGNGIHKTLPLNQLQQNHILNRSRPVSMPNMNAMQNSYYKCEELMQAASLARQQLISSSSTTTKRANAYPVNSPRPYKKRCKVEEEGNASLPPSPPASLNESPQSDVPHHSPETPSANMDIKQENGEETDGELQIDESAGQTPSEGTESDTQSLRGSSTNSPEPAEEEPKRHSASPAVRLNSPANNNQATITVKQEKPAGASHKCCEKQYTHQDLDNGIEAVISGQLTPSNAIKQFNIPRRTFFRRLSAVRKSRGIASAKDNASEYYQKNYYKRVNGSTPPTPAQSKPCLILPTGSVITSEIENNQYPTIRIKEEKALDLNGLDKKDDPNAENLQYLQLLNLTPNYEACINYLRMMSNNGDNSVSSVESKENQQIPSSVKQVLDDNYKRRKAEVTEKAISLVTHGAHSN